MIPTNNPQNINPGGARQLEHWDFKARVAIEGIGPSEIADKLELYEKHYDEWLQAFGERHALRICEEMSGSANTDFVGKMLCTIFPKTVSDMLERTREATVVMVNGACKIFRQEIEELALAHAKSLTDLRAAAVRESFHAQYCKMVEENRQLRSFLMNNYPAYVETADALKIPLIEISKKIMLDQKKAAGTDSTPIAPADLQALRDLKEADNAGR